MLHMSLNLVFRIIDIFASMSALVLYSVGFLFCCLCVQTRLSTSATSHTSGSSRLLLSVPKSRRTTCSWVRAGQYCWRQLISHSLTSLFWLQESRAWDTLSVTGTDSVHWIQWGLGAEFRFIRWSLSCVGRISCRTFQRNDWFSESRPFKEASLQVVPQSSWGLFRSHLQGMYLTRRSAPVSIVMFSSIRFLYICPEVKSDRSWLNSLFIFLLCQTSHPGRKGFSLALSFPCLLLHDTRTNHCGTD